MKTSCDCNVVKSFGKFRKETRELVGRLRREFEYREKNGKQCSSDEVLKELIESFIVKMEEA